jgi:hypothetical protein
MGEKSTRHLLSVLLREFWQCILQTQLMSIFSFVLSIGQRRPSLPAFGTDWQAHHQPLILQLRKKKKLNNIFVNNKQNLFYVF